MILPRLTSAVLASAVFLSIAPAALAQTSDEIIELQKTMKVQSVCEGRDRSLRNYGKCIGDAINRIKKLRDDLKDALEIERNEWYLENSHLGVSEEYRIALKAFTDAVAEKRRIFNNQQRAIEKAFFNEQKNIRLSGFSASSSAPSRAITSQPVNSSAEAVAREKCGNQKDKSAMRICMRQQLRMINISARRGSAAIRTNGAQ